MSAPLITTNAAALPPDRGPAITSTAIFFITLAWISVILRCSVRIFISRIFRIDDWLAVATLIFFTAFCFIVLVGVKYGEGRVNAAISDASYREALKWWYCGALTYPAATCLIKLTIASTLLHICVNKWQKRFIWGLIVVFTSYTVGLTFIMAFQCNPVSFFWMEYAFKEPPITTNGVCNHRKTVIASTLTYGVLSAIFDWTLGIMPFFLVWNLQMNSRTKMSVAFILAFGAIGSVATIVRMPYVHKLTVATDFLYGDTEVSICSIVEPGVGIAASSMATMRPLFSSCLNGARQTKLPNRYYHSHSNKEDSSKRGNVYENVSEDGDEVQLTDVDVLPKAKTNMKRDSRPAVAKSIVVTTTVQTGSSRKSFVDIEAGTRGAMMGESKGECWE